MAVTDYEYYNDSTLHGNYQFVTIEEVINNYLMSRVDDDYTINVPRYKILYQAMRGLRELTFDVTKEIKAIELELDPSTLSVVLPPDFINYVRISYVDEFGKLHVMSVDNTLSLAKEYLQDDVYGLLFDANGCVLQGDSENSPTNEVLSADGGEGYYNYAFHETSFRPNLDTSKIFENGSYTVDKNNGVIRFGSSVGGKDIVLEYISDALYSGCEGRAENEIRVHKFAETALIDYIYHELVKGSRAPANEKLRARKEFWNSRRLAKLRISTLRPKEILQAFRKQSKWIKK